MSHIQSDAVMRTNPFSDRNVSVQESKQKRFAAEKRPGEIRVRQKIDRGRGRGRKEEVNTGRT